jgi:hypothetical protein
LPLQVHGHGVANNTINSVRIISVPVDHYLSCEQIKQLEAGEKPIERFEPLVLSEPAAIEHVRPAEPVPIEDERRLAELMAKPYEELLKMAGLSDVEQA